MPCRWKPARVIDKGMMQNMARFMGGQHGDVLRGSRAGSRAHSRAWSHLPRQLVFSTAAGATGGTADAQARSNKSTEDIEDMLRKCLSEMVEELKKVLEPLVISPNKFLAGNTPRNPPSEVAGWQGGARLPSPSPCMHTRASLLSARAAAALAAALAAAVAAALATAALDRAAFTPLCTGRATTCSAPPPPSPPPSVCVCVCAVQV